MFFHCFTTTLLHAGGVDGREGYAEGSRGSLLRVIKVNTFEPKLKTLTPRGTLTGYGFRADKVKLYGKHSEDSRETRVKGFGMPGEPRRERS